MKIGRVTKEKRRAILSAGFLIGTVLWLTSLWLIPEKEIARLNELTVNPELRWMKGGGFLIAVVSASGLTLDAAHHNLRPRIENTVSRIDSTLKHPLNWLIFALMTYTAYRPDIEILALNLFTIMYLTVYRVFYN